MRVLNVWNIDFAESCLTFEGPKLVPNMYENWRVILVWQKSHVVVSKLVSKNIHKHPDGLTCDLIDGCLAFKQVTSFIDHEYPLVYDGTPSVNTLLEVEYGELFLLFGTKVDQSFLICSPVNYIVLIDDEARLLAHISYRNSFDFVVF